MNRSELSFHWQNTQSLVKINSFKINMDNDFVICFHEDELTRIKILTSCFYFYPQFMHLFLTHIRLASFVWDIGKQNSHRCDSVKWGYSVCLHENPKNYIGLIQLIRKGRIWVNSNNQKGLAGVPAAQVIIVLRFYVPPTVRVIQRQDLHFKSLLKD